MLCAQKVVGVSTQTKWEFPYNDRLFPVFDVFNHHRHSYRTKNFHASLATLREQTQYVQEASFPLSATSSYTSLLNVCMLPPPMEADYEYSSLYVPHHLCMPLVLSVRLTSCTS
eukprot:GHVQ01024664.1.p2 GENE.GHVQ01024664.1~~GHVQ01024664.1.p2  ORF type:complete len:114 (+),score=15.39 GHVQ01024664.1:41-382(+)